MHWHRWSKWWPVDGVSLRVGRYCRMCGKKQTRAGMSIFLLGLSAGVLITYGVARLGGYR